MKFILHFLKYNRTVAFSLVCLLMSVFSYGQNRSAIGTTTPDPSAAYEIYSTTKGFLPPRMTTVQRNAIGAQAGLFIYNTDVQCLEFYNGTSWFNLCNGGGSMRITSQPVPVTICPTGSGSLTVVATGTGLTYSWRKNGVTLVNGGAVSGQGTPTITLTNPSLSDAGNYEVVIGDASPWTVVSYNAPVRVYDNSLTVSGIQTTLEDHFTLTAYSPEAVINWYAAPTGGSPLATGTRFTVPTTAGSGITYYAEAVCSAGCVSARKAVTLSASLVKGKAAGGKTWMTYNLGATTPDVASTATDYKQYGSLFQWGRKADGHERINWTSPTTGTPVITTLVNVQLNEPIAVGTGFVKGFSDWRIVQNDNLWNGTGAVNNPCPAGFRIPTNAEWTAEVTAQGITNLTTAYSSNLKLLAAGFRASDDGSLADTGSHGYYWSSTISGPYAHGRDFASGSADSNYAYYRACGFFVRCFKD